MRSPFARLAFAVVLLVVYYRTLFDTATPAAASVVDAATLRDIDASQVAFSAGRFADALDPTERLTTQLPSQAMYFERLARIQRELGRPREEARAWEGVFRASPTPSDACPMLGAAYDRIPDPVRAVNAYERCVELDPENSDLLLFLGRAYNAEGRAKAAERVLEKALKITPKYPDVYFVLGVSNFLDGDLRAARARFERFTVLAPARREEVAVWLERTRNVPR